LKKFLDPKTGNNLETWNNILDTSAHCFTYSSAEPCNMVFTKVFKSFWHWTRQHCKKKKIYYSAWYCASALNHPCYL